jgi:hypothetical protein
MKRTPPPFADSRRLYKVFVSGTFVDNKERRKLVQDAIAMADIVWHGMDIFTASTRPTVEESLRYAREAGLFRSASKTKTEAPNPPGPNPTIPGSGAKKNPEPTPPAGRTSSATAGMTCI